MASKPAGKSANKSPKAPALVRQPNGRGALLSGGKPGNAGGGRPPDEVRSALRELGHRKSVPFLTRLLEGNVEVSLLGKCEACEHEQALSQEWVEMVMDRLKASVDQRLKASEQTLKYGLQSKELVIASGNASNFFDCVHQAIVEQWGDEAAERVKGRAMTLMQAVA